MKRAGFIIIVLFLVSATLMAQRQGRRYDEAFDKYKSERIAFLTEKLILTVAEAEKFWPVYNEYQVKREELMRASRPSFRRPDPDSLSIKEMKDLMDAKIQNDLRLAEMAEDYHEKFTKLLGVKKVFVLYHAEQEFMTYMLRRMRWNENSPGSNHQQGRDFNPNYR